jgi:hypothetical protein
MSPGCVASRFRRVLFSDERSSLTRLYSVITFASTVAFARNASCVGAALKTGVGPCEAVQVAPCEAFERPQRRRPRRCWSRTADRIDIITASLTTIARSRSPSLVREGITRRPT